MTNGRILVIVGLPSMYPHGVRVAYYPDGFGDNAIADHAGGELGFDEDRTKTLAELKDALTKEHGDGIDVWIEEAWI